MEVVAKAVRRGDEEDLELPAVLFVDSPVADLHTVAFELRPCGVDVAHENRCTILRAIAAIDGEPDAGAVAFHDDGGLGRGVTCYLDHPEMLRVPIRCLVQVRYRERQDILAVRDCFLKDCSLRHEPIRAGRMNFATARDWSNNVSSRSVTS